MLVARHFRRRLLILSVSTLGFFISSFSAVLALDFTGPVVSILDGDTIEVLHNHHPQCIRLPQSQRHSKERRASLNRKNGEARILRVPSFAVSVIWKPQNRTCQQSE
jgi:endonuclease YncB( thermonuclease family)